MVTYARPIVASLLQSGLAGTLGYTVTSAAGSPLIARTTSGVTEFGSSAIYSASVASWDPTWSGTIAWDAGAGTLAIEPFLAEDPGAILPAVDGSGRVLLQPTQAGVTIPTVSTVTDKAGYSLADASITSAKFTIGTVNPTATGFLERLMMLAARFFPLPGGSVTAPKSGNGNLVVRGAGGTAISTQAVTDDGTTQTLNPGA